MERFRFRKGRVTGKKRLRFVDCREGVGGEVRDGKCEREVNGHAGQDPGPCKRRERKGAGLYLKRQWLSVFQNCRKACLHRRGEQHITSHKTNKKKSASSHTWQNHIAKCILRRRS